MGKQNAKAALVTRGLVEMIRFGVLAGGKANTFIGLTGIGDLMVTCNSYHSRNFQAGLEIGKAVPHVPEPRIVHFIYFLSRQIIFIGVPSKSKELLNLFSKYLS